MKYELFFKSADDGFNLEAFQNYFDGLDHYNVEGFQAFYSNEDTGVYFVFSYLHEDGKGSYNVRSEGVYRISLNLDYCVPAFFANEALYEVEALMNGAAMTMYDPQPDGVGLKGYDPEIMFESWIHQNEEAMKQWAIESALNGDNDEPIVAPYEWLHRVWLWNYTKVRMQQKLGDDIYVPAIKFLTDGEMVKVGVIWPDGKSIAIPKVDLVIVARSNNKNNDVEYCVVPYEDIKRFVDKYTSHTDGDAYILSYEAVPTDIASFVADVKYNSSFQIIGIDEILEEEVVEEALFPNDAV